MDFELPEELRLLKETLRRYVDSEMIPIEKGTCDGVKLKPEYRKKFDEDSKRLGLWLMDVPEEFGGQGLPSVLNTVMQEFISSANLALGMYPGLTQGAIAALLVHGTEEQRKTFLP